MLGSEADWWYQRIVAIAKKEVNVTVVLIITIAESKPDQFQERDDRTALPTSASSAASTA